MVSTAKTNGDFGPLSPPAAASLPSHWSYSKRASSITRARLERNRSQLTIAKWPLHRSCSSSGENLQCVISLPLLGLSPDGADRVSPRRDLQRKCWWDGIEVELKQAGENRNIKLWARRVWTLELSLVRRTNSGQVKGSTDKASRICHRRSKLGYTWLRRTAVLVWARSCAGVR